MAPSVLVADAFAFAATAACLALGPHREAVRASVLMVEVEDGKTAAETWMRGPDQAPRPFHRLHPAPNADLRAAGGASQPAK